MDYYYVYVLKSMRTGRRYIGYTCNIERRLKEHNQGLSRHTKTQRPWVLIFKEECPNRLKAKQRERFLKTGHGRAFLNRIFS